MAKPAFTHRELCDMAAKWVKRPASQNGHGCHIAIVEPRTYKECPDVIAFKHGGTEAGSVVIEAKTSRADFLVDAKKPHREAAIGMGRWRYFICPEGLIQIEDLPQGWGLIWVNSRGHVKIIAGACACNNGYWIERGPSFEKWQFTERNMEQEFTILVMTLNRINDPEEVNQRIRKANAATAKYNALVIEHQGLKDDHRRLERENERLKRKIETGTSTTKNEDKNGSTFIF